MAKRRKTKRQKVKQAAKQNFQKMNRPVERIRRALAKLDEGLIDDALNLARSAAKSANDEDTLNRANEIVGEMHFRSAAEAVDGVTRLEHLDAALKLFPNELRFHYHRGIALMQVEKPSDALAAFNRVALAEPENANVRSLIGIAKVAAGDTLAPDDGQAGANSLDALIVKLQKGAKGRDIAPLLEGPFFKAHLEIWQALLKMYESDTSAPAAILEEPARADSLQTDSPMVDSPILAYYRGVAALRKKDVAAAKSAWAAIESVVATPWASANFVGMATERVADLREREQWSEIVSFVDDLPTDGKETAVTKALAEQVGYAYAQLGYVAAQEDEWRQARTYWKQASKHVNNRQLAQNVALAEEALELWVTAAEAWREVVKRRPRKKDHPDYLTDMQVATIWKHAANCYWREDLLEDALTCLKSAVKYAPENIEIRLELVDLYVYDDREDAAMNELDRILKMEPKSLAALERKGAIASQGWRNDAEEIWRKILEIDPSHKSAAERLARTYLERAERVAAMGGNSFFSRAKNEKPITILLEGLEEVPNSSILLLAVGMHYVREVEGEEELARSYLRRAWDAAPSDMQIVDYCMHELLHVGGEADVEAMILHVRKMTGLLPTFWVEQVGRALECEFDEEWPERFAAEALLLAQPVGQKFSHAYLLVQIFEAAHEEDDLHFASIYEARIRQEVPKSGAVEYIDAYLQWQYEEADNSSTVRRLLSRAQTLARKANEVGLREHAEMFDDVLSGRMNPLLDIFGRMGMGDFRDGPPDPDEFVDMLENLDPDDIEELMGMIGE